MLKALAFSLSFLLFVQGTLLAHASEINFWKERRKNVPETRNAPKLASLPAHFPLNGSFPSELKTSLSKLKHSLPARLSRVPGWIQNAVSPFAKIHAAHWSKNSSAKTVLLVQDIHLHKEGQRNIAGLVDSLGRALKDQSSSLLVGLEGLHVEEANYGGYNRYPHRKTLREVAEAFLDLNVINGVELAAIGYQGDGKEAPVDLPFTVMGVEDQSQYEANVMALRASVPLKEKARDALLDYKKELMALKKRHYNKKLTEFDTKYSSFKEGILNVPAYVLYLDSLIPAQTQNLRNLIEAVLLEGSIDLVKVEHERGRMLEVLVNKISEVESQTLLQYTNLYRMGQASYGGFYGYLKGLCQSNGVDLKNYPEMSLYIQYVLKSKAIDYQTLIQDLNDLESEVQNKLAPTEPQKAIIQLTQNYYALQKLTQHSLTEKEWSRYLNNDPHTKPWIRPFENFYRLAVARNKTMVDRLATRFENSDVKTAVLVAGGFHTNGLVEGLKEKGFSILTLSPKITKIDENAPTSLDILASNQLPLDQLFSGERLFLPTPAVASGAKGPVNANRILGFLISLSNAKRRGSTGMSDNGQFLAKPHKGGLLPKGAALIGLGRINYSVQDHHLREAAPFVGFGSFFIGLADLLFNKSQLFGPWPMVLIIVSTWLFFNHRPVLAPAGFGMWDEGIPISNPVPEKSDFGLNQILKMVRPKEGKTVPQGKGELLEGAGITGINPKNYSVEDAGLETKSILDSLDFSWVDLFIETSRLKRVSYWWQIEGAKRRIEEIWEQIKGVAALSLQPFQRENLSDFMMVYATLLNQTGNSVASTRILELASKISPDNIEIILALGSQYIRQRDFQRAAQHFKKSLGENPSAKELWSKLARAYYLMGDTKVGIDLMTSATELFPDCIQCRRDLIFLHVQGSNKALIQGDIEQSDAHLLKVQELASKKIGRRRPYLKRKIEHRMGLPLKQPSPDKRDAVLHAQNDSVGPLVLTHSRWNHIKENHVSDVPVPQGLGWKILFPPFLEDARILELIKEAMENGVSLKDVNPLWPNYSLVHYVSEELAEITGVEKIKLGHKDGYIVTAIPTMGPGVLSFYDGKKTSLENRSIGADQAYHWNRNTLNPILFLIGNREWGLRSLLVDDQKLFKPSSPLDRERFLWFALREARWAGRTKTEDFYRIDVSGTKWEEILNETDLMISVNRETFKFNQMSPYRKLQKWKISLIYLWSLADRLARRGKSPSTKNSEHDMGNSHDNPHSEGSAQSSFTRWVWEKITRQPSGTDPVPETIFTLIFEGARVFGLSGFLIYFASDLPPPLLWSFGALHAAQLLSFFFVEHDWSRNNGIVLTLMAFIYPAAAYQLGPQNKKEMAEILEALKKLEETKEKGRERFVWKEFLPALMITILLVAAILFFLLWIFPHANAAWMMQMTSVVFGFGVASVLGLGGEGAEEEQEEEPSGDNLSRRYFMQKTGGSIAMSEVDLDKFITGELKNHPAKMSAAQDVYFTLIEMIGGPTGMGYQFTLEKFMDNPGGFFGLSPWIELYYYYYRKEFSEDKQADPPSIIEDMVLSEEGGETNDLEEWARDIKSSDQSSPVDVDLSRKEFSVIQLWTYGHLYKGKRKILPLTEIWEKAIETKLEFYKRDVAEMREMNPEDPDNSVIREFLDEIKILEGYQLKVEEFKNLSPKEQRELLVSVIQARVDIIQTLYNQVKKMAPEWNQKFFRQWTKGLSKITKKAETNLRGLRQKLQNLKPKVPKWSTFFVFVAQSDENLLNDWDLLQSEVKRNSEKWGISLARGMVREGKDILPQISDLTLFNRSSQETIGVAMGNLSRREVQSLGQIWPLLMDTANPHLFWSLQYTPLAPSSQGPASLIEQFISWAENPEIGLHEVSHLADISSEDLTLMDEKFIKQWISKPSAQKVLESESSSKRKKSLLQSLGLDSLFENSDTPLPEQKPKEKNGLGSTQLIAAILIIGAVSAAVLSVLLGSFTPEDATKAMTAAGFGVTALGMTVLKGNSLSEIPDPMVQHLLASYPVKSILNVPQPHRTIHLGYDPNQVEWLPSENVVGREAEKLSKPLTAPVFDYNIVEFIREAGREKEWGKGGEGDYVMMSLQSKEVIEDLIRRHIQYLEVNNGGPSDIQNAKDVLHDLVDPHGKMKLITAAGHPLHELPDGTWDVTELYSYFIDQYTAVRPGSGIENLLFLSDQRKLTVADRLAGYVQVILQYHVFVPTPLGKSLKIVSYAAKFA